jgi:hypothetical protein
MLNSASNHIRILIADSKHEGTAAELVDLRNKFSAMLVAKPDYKALSQEGALAKPLHELVKGCQSMQEAIAKLPSDTASRHRQLILNTNNVVTSGDANVKAMLETFAFYHRALEFALARQREIAAGAENVENFVCGAITFDFAEPRTQEICELERETYTRELDALKDTFHNSFGWGVAHDYAKTWLRMKTGESLVREDSEYSHLTFSAATVDKHVNQIVDLNSRLFDKKAMELRGNMEIFAGDGNQMILELQNTTTRQGAFLEKMRMKVALLVMQVGHAGCDLTILEKDSTTIQELNVASVKIEAVLKQLRSACLGFNGVAGQSSLKCGPALEKFANMQIAVVALIASRQAMLADEKLMASLHSVKEICDKYPTISPGSKASLAELNLLASEVDLTTSLPSHYGCLKSLNSTLGGLASEATKEKVDALLTVAMIKMCSISALQMLARGDATETATWPETHLKASGVQLAKLPDAIQEAFVVGAAVGPG